MPASSCPRTSPPRRLVSRRMAAKCTFLLFTAGIVSLCAQKGEKLPPPAQVFREGSLVPIAFHVELDGRIVEKLGYGEVLLWEGRRAARFPPV